MAVAQTGKATFVFISMGAIQAFRSECPQAGPAA